MPRLAPPFALLLLAGTLLGGCDVPQVPKSAASAPSADASVAPAEDWKDAITKTPLPDPGDVAPVTDQPREFTAKDPVKGRRSRAAGGYLGAVGGARFWAEHQMIINNINHALQLFNAQEGRFPKSHEEFMQRIIQANNIQLPELVEGDEYVYVPEEAEKGLQIRRAGAAAGEGDATDDAAAEDAAAAESPSTDNP